MKRCRSVFVWCLAAVVLTGCDSTVVFDQECGNGVLEEGEECDGQDVGGMSCVDVFPTNEPYAGPQTAVPGCTETCEFDSKPCRMYCSACYYVALEVTVVTGDGTGLPPPGLWVESNIGGDYECACYPGSPRDCTAADACDGWYQFDGIGAGTIEVIAHAPGYKDVSTYVDFDADICGTPLKDSVELTMWPTGDPNESPPVIVPLTPGCI